MGVENQDSVKQLTEEFLRIREGLVYFAHQITKNHQDAEEVVSQTLEQLLKRLKSGSLPIQNLQYKAYIYRSVRNASFNVIRDRKKRAEKVIRLDHSDSVDPSQIDEINYEKLVALFMEAMEMLKNEDHREILALRILEGLEYNEIATATQTKLGTIMSRLSRAREAIRAVINDYPRFDDLKKFEIL